MIITMDFFALSRKGSHINLTTSVPFTHSSYVFIITCSMNYTLNMKIINSIGFFSPDMSCIYQV